MNRRRFFKFLAAAPVAAVAAPALWGEGMSPSEVNASLREAMIPIGRFIPTGTVRLSGARFAYHRIGWTKFVRRPNGTVDVWVKMESSDVTPIESLQRKLRTAKRMERS